MGGAFRGRQKDRHIDRLTKAKEAKPVTKDERSVSAALKDRVQPKGPGTKYQSEGSGKHGPAPGLAPMTHHAAKSAKRK